MRKSRSIPAWLTLLCAALVGVAWTGLLPRGTFLDGLSPQARFVRHWHSGLSHCADSAAAEALLKHNKEGGEVAMMADGSWVSVVMEHSCCTGAGFNATLYVASTGEAVLDPESCYCGWMPLGEEIYNHPKTSVSDFLAAVGTDGKKIIRL
ncbi:MAG: hypothetical protein EOP86_18635 [Verrucomicrobiaceae bacterium]|nr:MAG: hypothetical protein EOP86_18635 [Verrucomicrobiaceae bacterium]